MKLNLAKDVKDKKKGSCKYTGNKRKTIDNVGPLLNKTGTWLHRAWKKLRY